jgi:alanyl-tRNA synthetase
MTERLYYTDPYLRRFDATVRRVDTRDGRTAVFLDRTAFYPTSGGQPFDVGVLGGAPVVDVFDEDDGTVVHVLDATSSNTPALSPGARIAGEIDWPRRFDHMQQHTGQHVLSAAFDRCYGVRTMSFHMGAEVSTIDLAREMTTDELARAEDAANAIVWEDRPVTMRFVSSEEAAGLPLRKEPVREGTLRLVDVDQWDLSACGGTHVARTGAIGTIAISAWERFKGGQRVQFLCGARALHRFRSTRDWLAAGVRLLSILPDELPAAIERLQSELKDQKRTGAALQSELVKFRAAELAESAEAGTHGRLVLKVVDADANGLKVLASAVTTAPGYVVVLCSASSPVLVVAARSADVNVSAQQVIANITASFGGRGGGRPELAQAGGLTGSPDAVLACARASLNG